MIFQFHTVIHSKLSQLNLNALWMLVFLSTALLPVVSGMLISGIRDIRDLPSLNDQGRRIFMMATGVYQLLLLYMFVRAGMHYFVLPFFVGGAVSLFVCTLVSFKMRMSLHALGWGGLLSMLIFLMPHASSDFFFVILAVLIISGVVMSARLILQAHSRREVYAGFLTSLSLMSIIFIIYGYRI